MTLVRSESNPASPDARVAIPKLVDPLAKAIDIIATTPDLDDDQKRRVATDFSDRHRDVPVKDYLSILARRAVKEAGEAGTASLQSATSETSTPPAVSGNIPEKVQPQRKRVLWHRPRQRGARSRH